MVRSQGIEKRNAGVEGETEEDTDCDSTLQLSCLLPVTHTLRKQLANEQSNKRYNGGTSRLGRKPHACLWFLPSTFPVLLMDINSKSFAIREITKPLLIAFCLSFFWGPWVTKYCQGGQGPTHTPLLYLKVITLWETHLSCQARASCFWSFWETSHLSCWYVPMSMVVNTDGLPCRGQTVKNTGFPTLTVTTLSHGKGITHLGSMWLPKQIYYRPCAGKKGEINLDEAMRGTIKCRVG